MKLYDKAGNIACEPLSSGSCIATGYGLQRQNSVGMASGISGTAAWRVILNTCYRSVFGCETQFAELCTTKTVKEPQGEYTLYDGMHIDPVVELADQLRSAERKLHDERVRCDPLCCSKVVAEISALNERLYEAVPTSSLGSAELLERIASALDETSKLCAWRLRQIAYRLGCGERSLEDIVFLRRLLPQFSRRLYGDEGFVVAPMLAAAIEGAARPVLIYRAALPPVAKRWGRASA